MKLKKSFILILILGCSLCVINANDNNAADTDSISLDLDCPDIDFEELKERAILAIQQRKAILDKLKSKLDGLERNADSVAQDEKLFRAITNDLDIMFPGEGEIWDRLDKVIGQFKALKKEEKFRKKKAYVVGKAFIVSVITSIAMYFGLKYYDSLDDDGN